ncbi:MAG TPA: hypothetical protein VI299_12090 [Polyangiales bacterium]
MQHALVLGQDGLVTQQTVDASARGSRVPPHVLLVVLVGCSREQLGCFGNEARTPHIDRLSLDGLRFLASQQLPEATSAPGYDLARQTMSKLGYYGFRASTGELALQWTSQPHDSTALRLACMRHIGTQRVAERALAFMARTRRDCPERRMFLQLDFDVSAGGTELRHADDQVGRVLKALQRVNELDGTLVMVIAACAPNQEEVMVMRWRDRIVGRGELRLRCAPPSEVLATLLSPFAGRHRNGPRNQEQVPVLTQPRSPSLSKKYVYYPGRSRVPDTIPQALLDRPHRISGSIVTHRDARGTVICHASVSGGYALFIEDRSVHYLLTYLGGRTIRLQSRDVLPLGKCDIRLDYRPASAEAVASGRRAPGRVRLLVGGRLQAYADLPVAMPLMLALAGRCQGARPDQDAILRCYERAPFAVGYDLRRVAVEVGPELHIDARAEVSAVTRGQRP